MPELARFLPSTRSVLVGVGLLLAAVAAYGAAWGTSLFAVRTVDVRGGTPLIRAEVRHALSAEIGRSLLRVGEPELARELAGVTYVRSFHFDRAFPGTLRVTIRREWPVLVLHRGRDAFLVSATGRVLKPLQHPHRSSLPHLWVPSRTPVNVGETLPGKDGGAAAAALAPLRSNTLHVHVHTLRVSSTELTLVLSSGLELRLGDAGDVRLKLAIAGRILRQTGASIATSGYLDVSVPERPVLNLNSQVVG